MTNYTNTDVMSRLSEKLTASVGDIGSDKPAYLELWTDNRVPTSLYDHFMNMFGFFRTTKSHDLIIRFSDTSGYTLEGATWREIQRKTGWSITEFVREIVQVLTTEYELAGGWEVSLLETLAELDELKIGE